MNEAASAPPKSPSTEPSNAAQLRADIDSGATGEKAAASDPAAAPLGTDDEAGGAPPGNSNAEKTRPADPSGAAKKAQSKELTHNTSDKPAPGLGLIIGVVAALLLVAVLAWLTIGR